MVAENEFHLHSNPQLCPSPGRRVRFVDVCPAGRAFVGTTVERSTDFLATLDTEEGLVIKVGPAILAVSKGT